MGLYADVSFLEVAFERRQPLDHAVAFFPQLFSGRTEMPDEALRSVVPDTLSPLAEGGEVLRRTRGRTATLIWKV